MDSPYDHSSHEDAPPAPDEAKLRAALERSAADVVAGRLVPAADIFAEIDQSLRRMEKQTARR